MIPKIIGKTVDKEGFDLSCPVSCDCECHDKYDAWIYCENPECLKRRTSKNEKEKVLGMRKL